jgi:hypothetical protein
MGKSLWFPVKIFPNKPIHGMREKTWFHPVFNYLEDHPATHKFWDNPRNEGLPNHRIEMD